METKIDAAVLNRLCALSKISVSEGEEAEVLSRLNAAAAYCAKAADSAKEFKPYMPNAVRLSDLRSDTPAREVTRAEALANAPKTFNGEYIQVPPVIE